MVAALTGEKDHTTFVESARIILTQIPEARFFIIGEGPEEKRIAGMIRHLGLESRMFLTGFLSNIGEVMPELDLMVMTSRSEGLGSSILDAFASRVPVVATDAGGIPEIVRDRETGMLAPVGSAESLARKGIEVLNDRALSERLVAGAYELLIDRHTDERMATDTFHQYRHAVDANPRRRLFQPQAAV
jgi:glycosyltransferase involved in cell wall biosynthesis